MNINHVFERIYHTMKTETVNHARLFFYIALGAALGAIVIRKGTNR